VDEPAVEVKRTGDGYVLGVDAHAVHALITDGARGIPFEVTQQAGALGGQVRAARGG
jgi:hypothetical protein